MRLEERDQQFLESLARSDVGKDLIALLKRIESYYADIRNLQGVDALKLFRESLLDRLLVLSGEQEPPNGDDYY